MRGRTLKSTPPTVFAVAVIIAAAMVILHNLIIARLPFAEQLVTQLEPRHERELDLFVQQSTLLTTLTTGVLAALGAVVLTFKDQALRHHELIPFVATIVLAGLSLYFGYEAYEQAMLMLRIKIFNLDSPVVLWPRRLQFYTFLASTICGLYFVLARVSNR